MKLPLLILIFTSCHTTKVTCYRKTPETFHLTKELFEWRINQPCGFIKNDTVWVDGKKYIIEFAPYK